ncbi:calcium homeostasis modulator protein 5-like isoform X2 [Protopterus annectens]|uniref:calcium homeostasis modulator protein 5-like isoform X2 n=1 Tax=Protopterus annectens TaxID=7888 RepID=UPI001CFAEE58|nr:calcium homeostasis modulator protein 5-like isoform X2 [Protopterus annectens]
MQFDMEIGWGLMAFTAIALLLILCCSACRSHLRYQQEVFWEKYKEKEMEYFQQFSEDYAAKLAEHNLRSFFENKKTDSVSLPSDKAWDEISALHCFNMANQYYSSLHQYVDGEKKENNEDIPSALA